MTRLIFVTQTIDTANKSKYFIAMMNVVSVFCMIDAHRVCVREREWCNDYVKRQ